MFFWWCFMPENLEIFSGAFDALRRAIEAYLNDPKHTAKSLSIESGVPENTISMFRSLQRPTMGEKYFKPLWEFLGKNPEFGLPKIEDLNPAHRVGLTLKHTRPRGTSAGRKPVSPTINDHDPEGHFPEPNEPIPDTATVTDDEYLLILAARAAGAHPDEALQHLRLRITASSLTNGQRSAMILVIDKKYLEAAETLIRLAKTQTRVDKDSL
jgi:hypothetical protein